MQVLLEISERSLSDFREAQIANVVSRACRIAAYTPKHPVSGRQMIMHRIEFSGRPEDLRRRRSRLDFFEWLLDSKQPVA